jgi:AbrB family looped-hinge helix DNA binding protein
MDEEVARISQGGRVVIPARIRKALGVTVGDRVVLRVANGQMTLVTTERALQEAQALVRRYVPKGRSLVGELIRERRRAAARE